VYIRRSLRNVGAANQRRVIIWSKPSPLHPRTCRSIIDRACNSRSNTPPGRAEALHHASPRVARFRAKKCALAHKTHSSRYLCIYRRASAVFSKFAYNARSQKQQTRRNVQTRRHVDMSSADILIHPYPWLGEFCTSANKKWCSFETARASFSHIFP